MKYWEFIADKLNGGHAGDRVRGDMKHPSDRFERSPAFAAASALDLSCRLQPQFHPRPALEHTRQHFTQTKTARLEH